MASNDNLVKINHHGAQGGKTVVHVGHVQTRYADHQDQAEAWGDTFFSII